MFPEHYKSQENCLQTSQLQELFTNFVFVPRSVTNVYRGLYKNYTKSYLGHRSVLDGLAYSRSIVEEVKNEFEPVGTRYYIGLAACFLLNTTWLNASSSLNFINQPLLYIDLVFHNMLLEACDFIGQKCKHYLTLDN